MELKFLGRGSAFNVKEGNTSAYIKKNGTLFLIDCGSNIFERIINNNLLEGVENVYVAITHRHPDHVGSLGDLIFYCYYVLKIKVCLLDNYDYELRQYLLTVGVTRDKYNTSDNYIEDLNLNIQKVSAYHCKVYQNAHGDIYDNYRESDNPINLFECNSFKITYNNKSIFYSGDTSYVLFREVRDYDEYYIDCCIADYNGNVHYNVNKLYSDCIDANINIQKVWCMHFDSDEAIDRAKELGFNVVEVI